jgi:hypothetical protein
MEETTAKGIKDSFELKKWEIYDHYKNLPKTQLNQERMTGEVMQASLVALEEMYFYATGLEEKSDE